MTIKGDIPLAVVGCDFRIASSQWRSRLTLSGEEACELARELGRGQAASGFFDLNTCNRTEWIVSSEDSRWAAELLRGQMIRRAGPEAEGWLEPYLYTGEDAARHVFRVAIGQESLVVGERQISGQLYRALEAARQRGTSSRVLNGLGSTAGRLVRIALRRGAIEHAAVGVHSLAIEYLLDKLRDARTARLAVVGMGRIGRRVRGAIRQVLNAEPVCLNRTVGSDADENIEPLSRLAAVLAEADAAVICTGALSPVVYEEHLQERSPGNDLLLLDIGIPHQVDRQALPGGVQVADLDELTEYHHCVEARGVKNEARQGEAAGLVERAVTEFRAFCNEEVFSGILDTVQRHHRQLVGEEIPRIIADRLSYLSESDRSRLELDLKNIILEYTTEVFRTIKETSGGDTDGGLDECGNES